MDAFVHHLLFFGQWYIPSGVCFLGQIETVFLEYPIAEPVDALGQFLEIAVSDHLCERATTHVLFLDHSVSALECPVAIVSKETRSKELALRIHIEGRLRYWRTSQEPTVREPCCDFHESLGAFGLVVFDGGAFINGNHTELA